MKSILIGIFLLGSISSFAGSKIWLNNSSALLCEDTYIDYALSRGIIFDQIEDMVESPESTNLRKAGGLTLALASMPLAPIVNVPSQIIKNSRGKFGLSLLDKNSKQFQKMFHYAKSINLEISKEEFEQLIADGFAEVFCSSKVPAGKKMVKNYIRKKLE